MSTSMSVYHYTDTLGRRTGGLGGVTRKFAAPVWGDGVDALLRVCRQFWPHAVFRDSEAVTDVSLDHESVWRQSGSAREFFICRDEEASRSWDAEGPTDANKNQMLHFIVEKNPTGPTRSVTVVYDEDDPGAEVALMLDSFSSAMQSLWGLAVIVDRDRIHLEGDYALRKNA